MRSPLLLSVSLLLAAGCAVDTESDLQLAEHGEDEEECECKIEGSAIGVVGTIVHVGGDIVVFESWTPKADSPGEYVGFTLSANAAGLDYLVKAGTDVFAASGTSWSHPDGSSGSEVNAISNVDLCPPDDEGGDDDDGGGEEDPPPDID